MSDRWGIFRANGRLGFWDSANSISWSSLFDKADFTPAIETLAGNVTFNDVLGRIVSIKASGSGFVIYSTKNIVGAAYSTGEVSRLMLRLLLKLLGYGPPSRYVLEF